jgi:hypothetical protein
MREALNTKKPSTKQNVMFKGSKLETVKIVFLAIQKHTVFAFGFLNFGIVSDLGTSKLEFPAFLTDPLRNAG